ncbi:MAG: tRNA uridine-5-carboxymethylaminomethyl(34) synthesis enzyme MnmG, partial [Clostridia bacterium]|nr:tRNA uridine-5-carboxymethylaminomethyl(34) synthesis enzyme MnmG [Clostridia bacterium]
TGPRYCPSIEDKVVRFAEKTRHQLFVEEMGFGCDEIYLQGFSSSLPAEVQYRMLRTLPGFEKAQIMRFAYAIEYDCAIPTQLFPSLEFKTVEGLFGAGQFNGTSGYEEAAAQGLVAGINAARKIQGLPPMILSRDSSYIGTLIDDLVTKGTGEPYRMMTSRSEFRLLLRQDNADARLTPLGHEIGLISEDRWKAFGEKQDRIRKEIDRLEHATVGPTAEVNGFLEKNRSTPLKSGARLADLLRRPEMTSEALGEIDLDRKPLREDEKLSAEVAIKYEGYIRRQTEEARRFEQYESRLLPEDIDYTKILGLRTEAMQKLSAVRPASVGQASRISGVNPADISVLLIYLSSEKKKE